MTILTIMTCWVSFGINDNNYNDDKFDNCDLFTWWHLWQLLQSLQWFLWWINDCQYSHCSGGKVFPGQMAILLHITIMMIMKIMTILIIMPIYDDIEDDWLIDWDKSEDEDHHCQCPHDLSSNFGSSRRGVVAQPDGKLEF